MSILPEPPIFRFSDVLKLTFSVLWQNGFLFLPVAAAIMLPQTFLQTVFPADLSTFVNGFLDALRHIVLLTIEAILWASVEISLVYAVMQAVNRQSVDLRESILWSRPRLLSALIAALLLEFGISLPFGLLLEFGMGDNWGSWLVGLLCWLYAITIFTVALPALVVERCGILGCLKRSAYLTAGYRWPILAIWIVTVIAGAVVDVSIGQLAAMLSDGPASIAVQFLAELLDNSIIALFGAVVSIVIYSKLRVVKDGLCADSVASIFD